MRGRGGQRAAPMSAPAIDFAHLARQTAGDARLEREVLGLFMTELSAASVALASEHTDSQARRALAHRLVGAARAVGAFSLADSAAAVEISPHSAVAARSLLSQLDELHDVVAGLLAKPGRKPLG